MPEMRAYFQQVMPIERTAREPGHFQSHHQSHMTQPDLGNQALKSLSING